MADSWIMRYDGYDPADEGRRESLCTVGNGYVATRGAVAQSHADGVHYPGTYAAGIYNRLQDRIGDQVVQNESLVNLPNWLASGFRVEGGPWFDIDSAEILDHQQELDMRQALLTRRLRIRDGDGRTTTVVERRFVSMDLKHCCAMETTYLPEDWSGVLEVRSLLDGNVENTLVERYRDLSSNHLDLVESREVSADSVLLEMVTNQSGVRVAMAARTTVSRNDGPITPDRRLVEDGASIGHHLTLHVRRGEPTTVEKTVTLFTGRDRAVTEPAAEAVRWLARLGRFEDLLERHAMAWGHLWNRFHVDMGSKEEWLRIQRLHLVHLLQSVSMNTSDLDAGVPARGLHGEAYRGHILWDELFVFPVLNLRLPSLTSALLRYRYRRLPEARAAAREAGYDGAMFPWQSGSNGEEESQQVHLNPDSGRWIPDPTYRQRHVGIAIAYNVWQYYQVTGDQEFLIHYGAEMLLEIGRFWARIADFDDTLGRYVIRGVMGPDEFHSGYPGQAEEGIDNNAYTNVMASWVLRRAMEAVDLLPEQKRRELVETMGVDEAELDRWADVARLLLVPFHDGVISQFEGYGDLEELDWDSYRERYDDIHRLDRILEAENDTVNRYKASKQADVLMLFYLLSADELRETLGHLGYVLEPDVIPRTIEYYLARTSHGSTLSAVIHGWVLARAERERALDFLTRALEADVADVQGGTTPEAIHLAAMAGSVDLLQRCFSGLETWHDHLRLDPYWPEQLGVLEFSIMYREQPITLRIHGSGVEALAGPGMQRPVRVACREQTAELEPGATVSFPQQC